MKDTKSNNIQAVNKVTPYFASDLDALKDASPAQLRKLVIEAFKEIARLQKLNAKLKVTHHSEVERIQAECAEEIARDKTRVVVTVVDNGRDKPT